MLWYKGIWILPVLCEQLRDYGYLFNQEAHFWIKPPTSNIDYSDGESSELHALQTVQSARDLRTGSDDLAGRIMDWPSTIHFSPERANLLRPISRILQGRILEAGAGTGALTRYLGELGADVIALEGSRRRAEIAARRCRDLENVHVVCCDLSTFESGICFDAVVLVGVLEYTRIFDQGPGAIERVLAHLRRLLKPDGYLIIAIENQLGLKYFAGAAEDHVGQPFFGISDLYGDGSAVTFGRRELRDYVRAAGFGHVQFLYPLPDYKLPRLVIPEHTFSSAYLPEVVEVMRTVGTAGKQHYAPAFSERLAWRTIARNGLGEDFANSFLLIASPNRPNTPCCDPAILAYSFSTDRRRRFQIENRFTESGTGLRVTRTRIYPEESPNFGTIRQQLADTDFITGEVYVNTLHRALQSRGWTIADVEQWAKRYFHFLLTHATRSTDSDCLGQFLLPDDFLDCVPSNLVAHDRDLSVFDLEWSVTPPPSIQWVLFRGLFYSLLQARPVAPPTQDSMAAVLPIVLKVMSGLGYALDANSLNGVIAREEEFQRNVVGERSTLKGDFWHSAQLYLLGSDREISSTTDSTESRFVPTLRANAAELVRLTAEFNSGFREVTGNLNRVTENQQRIEGVLQSLTDSLRDTIQQHAVRTEQAQARTAAEVSHALSNLERIETRIAQLESRIAQAKGSASMRMGAARLHRFLVRLRTRTLFSLLALRFQSNAHNRRIVDQLRSSGLFDSEWYLDSYPDIRTLGIDPLIHYLLFGTTEHRDPNPLFDTRFYLEQNPDVATSGINPLWHYFSHGAHEGRNPHPQFDSTKYLEQNADVGESGANPLAHYLKHGKTEGRAIHAPDNARKELERPRTPDEAAWQELRGEHHSVAKTSPAVDVVIPVYRGYDETLACIYSVLSAPVQTAYELIVVDDCSPERDLSAALDDLARQGFIHLLRNDKNLGFVQSINRGVSLHTDRDVVLLNSDTIVYNNWLDRLRSAALSEQRVGTVTPLSNNATICSYPRFTENNNTVLELDIAELDRLTAAVNAGVRIPIPTAVGFCMYIRRECLAETGTFDAVRFGKGYGEENDFCMRASDGKWKHVLAADVFVRHHGSVSFGASARAGMAEASKRLLERFPDYDERIAGFIRDDLVKEVRRRLDIARLKRALGDDVFLFFGNPLGGGTDFHLQDLASRLRGEGIGVLFARSDRLQRNRIELTAGDAVGETPNIGKFNLVSDREQVIDLVHELGVRLIHVQHIIGFDPEFVQVLPQLAAQAGIPFDVTVHDYTAICPRVFLVNGTDEYCGEPPISECEMCVERNGSRFGPVSVAQWRERFAQLLGSARRVYVPSRDVAARLRKYFPHVRLFVRPHPETIPSTAARQLIRITRRERRVAVLGAIGRHKGYNLLRACAEDAHRRQLPLQFVVIGYTENDRELAGCPNITVAGKYNEHDIGELLAEQKCDLAWFPAICPETYGYTLSHALRSGLFPVAFDLGALPERIRAAGWGKVLPFEMSRHPKRVNDSLLAVSIEPAPATPVDWGASYLSLLGDYYGLLETCVSPEDAVCEERGAASISAHTDG